MNILGIDYGTKRIGIAIATTPLAEPLQVITNAIRNDEDVVTPQAMQALTKLIQENAIEKIIIGISEGAMAQKTRSFIEILQKTISVPIEEADETLSTYTATDILSKQRKSKREGPKDHIAAAAILQDYLDFL